MNTNLRPTLEASTPPSDRYRHIVLVLALTAAFGFLVFAASGLTLGSLVLLHAAVSVGLATGVLAGVGLAHTTRSALGSSPAKAVRATAEAALTPIEETERGDDTSPAPAEATASKPSLRQRLLRMPHTLRTLGSSRATPQPRAHDVLPVILVAFAALGTIVAQTMSLTPPAALGIALAAGAVAMAVAGVVLAATAVRYLAQIDPRDLPEAPALARGGRVLAWICGLAAAGVGAQWIDAAATPWALMTLSLAIVSVNAAICASLLMPGAESAERPTSFNADFAVTRLLGTRANVVASVLDAAQAQFGIDLRSTWALAVFRRSLEPLVVGLALVGWLTTSLTVVGVDEQALVERLGVPRGGAPLSPGLHVHLPWPLDRAYRIPARRVQALTVGHEGEEERGPENVLWAVEHAANEYTLLLGNGRDLVTIDATVQFRISDPRAWYYASQNPADALRAIAYRAVMRTTVNQTLADVLSENVVTMTSRMRLMLQQDADALGIGVQVLSFTIGGMHPPVAVASDYQAVVSAELGKVTAVVAAQAARNRTVPYAESAAVVSANAARALGADLRARAAGDAWSFRTLEAQYRAEPSEYLFRQRLEALERVLSQRRFTVLDQRIQRDGGELWMTP